MHEMINKINIQRYSQEPYDKPTYFTLILARSF
jgi:hypothetical protein